MISGVVPVRVEKTQTESLLKALGGHARNSAAIAVDVDVGRGGLDPVLHRERVGPGAAAADEEDVGIALLADLVHGGLNLRTESEGIAHNLLVTRLIEIEHI